MTPCRVCAMLIINCGIKRVVAQNDYHASAESKRIFEEAGLKLDILDSDTVKYAKM